MDAVEKAAKALFERHTNSDLRHGDTRDRVVRTVLAAVGYPAHQSSDERTCWCPVAEQAGRERDAAVGQRDSLHDAAVAVIRERDALRGEADELNTRVRELQAYIDTQPYPSDMEDVAAERDRLREALEVVASRNWGSVTGFGVTEGSYHIDPQALARAALDAEETP